MRGERERERERERETLTEAQKTDSLSWRNEREERINDWQRLQRV